MKAKHGGQVGRAWAYHQCLRLDRDEETRGRTLIVACPVLMPPPTPPLFPFPFRTHSAKSPAYPSAPTSLHSRWERTATILGSAAIMLTLHPAPSRIFRGHVAECVIAAAHCAQARWLMDNVPAVAEAGENAMFGTVDSWLIYHLTGGADGGVHVTDGAPPSPKTNGPTPSPSQHYPESRPCHHSTLRRGVPVTLAVHVVSNAARTMLLELSTLTWSEKMLQVFGLSRAMLPTLVSNSEIYGHIKYAKRTLSFSTPYSPPPTLDLSHNELRSTRRCDRPA
jgi:hypothetical protein